RGATMFLHRFVPRVERSVFLTSWRWGATTRRATTTSAAATRIKLDRNKAGSVRRPGTAEQCNPIARGALRDACRVASARVGKAGDHPRGENAFDLPARN